MRLDLHKCTLFTDYICSSLEVIKIVAIYHTTQLSNHVTVDTQTPYIQNESQTRSK